MAMAWGGKDERRFGHRRCQPWSCLSARVRARSQRVVGAGIGRQRSAWLATVVRWNNSISGKVGAEFPLQLRVQLDQQAANGRQGRRSCRAGRRDWYAARWRQTRRHGAAPASSARRPIVSRGRFGNCGRRQRRCGRVLLFGVSGNGRKHHEQVRAPCIRAAYAAAAAARSFGVENRALRHGDIADQPLIAAEQARTTTTTRIRHAGQPARTASISPSSTRYPRTST